MKSSAILSACGTYRYVLQRSFGPEGRKQLKHVLFVMLNPSTADASTNDPTVRRCLGFARDWGCGHLTIVNLFAYRTPAPARLAKLSLELAYGPRNGEHLLDELQWHFCRDHLIVAAWGAHPIAAQSPGYQLTREFNPHHLGLTRCGNPCHPLYLRRGTQPTRWVPL